MKILILGAGVQGSTVAKKASEEKKVEKIYIAD
jgi:saccharopine dehydrogenase-like NADP-dependent oxidoreductase